MSIDTISDGEFNAIRKIVFERSGINLTEVKRPLVVSRLMRRLRYLKLKSFTEYIEYLKKKDIVGREMEEMINRISTNKTEFFREDYHFSFLYTEILPHIQGPLQIWCAASSSGEEAYSIAITIEEYIRHTGRRLEYKLTASDISTEMLDRCRQGIYRTEEVAHLQQEWLERYFLKGKGQHEGDVRVKPGLREKVNFMQINLMDARYPLPRTLDVVFLRNVLIYFNVETKEALVNRIYEYLKPGGYLFLGHSESLLPFQSPYLSLKKNVYRKPLK